MTFSGYFTSKSVFDQQRCRALTFALARLSCIGTIHHWYNSVRSAVTATSELLALTFK